MGKSKQKNAPGGRQGLKAEGARFRPPRGSASYSFPESSQKATAEQAATFRESTPWAMGIFMV